MFITLKLNKILGVTSVVLGCLLLAISGNYFIKNKVVTVNGDVFKEEYIIAVDARTWLARRWSDFHKWY